MRYLYISLLLIAVIPSIVKGQIITTICGSGTGGLGDAGQASAAELGMPAGITIDAAGNIFIADQAANSVRKINTAGIINTIAGNGTVGYSGDGGPATAAQLYGPTGIVCDNAGNVYVSDQWNFCVRKINTNGIITTIAGIAVQGYTGDGGQATAAELNLVSGLTFDKNGNLYICDNGSSVVRMVNTAGIITRFAGTGIEGYSGDGGQAILAEFAAPSWLSIDTIGNFYISDETNNIRKINTAGIISTISNGSGIHQSEGLALDKAGNLYVADYENNQIVMISPFGTFATIVGTDTAGYSGDGGLATAAELYAPIGVTFDASGNLYIADMDNGVIRKVTNVGQAAGIEQFANSNEQITVYPNPTKDVLHIEGILLNEPTEVAIIDVLGNAVYHATFTTQHNTINIAELNSGVYVLELSNSKDRVAKRLIKE